MGLIVDGAGDQYAAGFLYGLSQGKALPVCARLGHIAAAEVISHYGARPEQSYKALATNAGLYSWTTMPERLQAHGISQAPVVREADAHEVTAFVGSIRERGLLDRLFRDPDALQADVAEVMAAPLPMVEFDDPVDVAFTALQDSPAVLVAKRDQVLGVLTRTDLLEFLAHRRQQQRG